MKFSQILAPIAAYLIQLTASLSDAFALIRSACVSIIDLMRGWFRPAPTTQTGGPFLAFLATSAVLMFIALAPAQAQTVNTPGDGIVLVPWGDWVGTAVKAMAGVFAAIAMWALRHVPTEYTWILRATRVDDLLEKAINYGINMTVGAVQGKSLKAEVGNQVVEHALEYAVAQAPQLIKRLGIGDTLKAKIVARLNLAEGVGWTEAVGLAEGTK